MSTNFVTAIGVSSNNSVAQCTDSVLHLLPCKIKCTCDNLDEDEQRRCTHPAKVDEYFSPIIRKLDKGEENNHCTASFRGRPLRGAVMNVPEGYQGVVLRENSGEIMEPNQVSNQDGNMITVSIIELHHNVRAIQLRIKALQKFFVFFSSNN